MMDFTQFEYAGWQRAADAYERGFFALTMQAASPLLDAAAVHAGDRVLDLASGPGAVAAAAAERGARVTGTDFSEAMLAMARRRHPGVTFERADAQALPYADASFEAVTMAFLLGHLADPERALAEARRVLVPGGRLAIAWWAGFEKAVGFGLIHDAVRRHGRTDVALPAGPPFDRFATAASYAPALTAAGFASVTVRELALSWRLASGATIVDIFYDGTVRTAGLLREQTPEALVAIRADVEEHARAYATGGAIVLPMPAWIVSAVAR